MATAATTAKTVTIEAIRVSHYILSMQLATHYIDYTDNRLKHFPKQIFIYCICWYQLYARLYELKLKGTPIQQVDVRMLVIVVSSFMIQIALSESKFHKLNV